MPKFGTKNALFAYFWAKIFKNYCHIWNQHPQICLLAKFSEKTKTPRFGTKNAWFGHFWTGICKQYCHIWNHHPQICIIAKFCGKTKMPKFGTKMPYLSILDQKCLILVFLGWNFKKLLAYLKSTPSNLSTFKILRKSKNA